MSENEEKPKVKMGRPRKEMDWEKFDTLCGYHMTLEDIAAMLGMDMDTVEKRCREDKGLSFSELWVQKSAPMRSRLRVTLWQIGLGTPNVYDKDTGKLLKKERQPDTGMCYFLARNHLGMKNTWDSDAVVPMEEMSGAALNKLTDREIEQKIKELLQKTGINGQKGKVGEAEPEKAEGSDSGSNGSARTPE